MEGHTEGTGTEDALLKVRKEGSGSGGGCEAEASRCAEKPTLAWGGKQRHSEFRVARADLLEAAAFGRMKYRTAPRHLRPVSP